MTDPNRSPLGHTTGAVSAAEVPETENGLTASSSSSSALESSSNSSSSDIGIDIPITTSRTRVHRRPATKTNSSILTGANDDAGTLYPEPLTSRFGAPRVRNLPSKESEIAVWWMWILVYLRAYKPPVFTWAREYQLKWFANDIAAGICTGILLLPQGMAYAALAGLSPVYGYYAALAPAIVYILLGPNAVIVIGPASVTCLLLGNAIADMPNPALAATTIGFFMGVGFLAIGFLRLGFIATIISKPIVVGFTAASALLVDTTQIRYVFGLTTMKSNSNIIEFFQKLGPAARAGGNGWAALMALTAIAILVALKISRKTRFVPGPVIVVIVAILLTWGLKLDKRAKLAIVGDIASGLPEPKSPFVSSKDLAKLGGGILVVSAISLVELISISKVFSVKEGKIMNTNMELVAVGAACLIGSFFQAFPSTASFSRTALNDGGGAKSQLSNVVAMVILVIVLSFAAKALYYLPFPILAAIVITSTLSLFDWREALRFWHTKKLDFIIMALTFVLTLLIGPEYGVLAAVALNIVILLWNQSMMKTRELAQLAKPPTSSLFDVQHPDIDEKDELKLMNAQGPSDALFVIKDYFPDAFVHPHLYIIRPMDSLTYVNIDAWFMDTYAQAYTHLAETYHLEDTDEMVEARQISSGGSTPTTADAALGATAEATVDVANSPILEDEDDEPSYSSSSRRSLGRRGRALSIGSVRFAENDEVSRREEEVNEQKVEQESKRSAIVQYAEKTQDLIGFVIVDMIHMNHIDSVVVGRLSDLFLTLQKNRISLAVARPRPQVLRYLITGKFVEQIGQDFVVDSVHTAVIRCNAVLRAARQFQAKQFLSSSETNLATPATPTNTATTTTSSEHISRSGSPEPLPKLSTPTKLKIPSTASESSKHSKHDLKHESKHDKHHKSTSATSTNMDADSVAIEMPVLQGKSSAEAPDQAEESSTSTSSITDEDPLV